MTLCLQDRVKLSVGIYGVIIISYCTPETKDRRTPFSAAWDFISRGCVNPYSEYEISMMHEKEERLTRITSRREYTIRPHICVADTALHDSMSTLYHSSNRCIARNHDIKPY